MSEATQQEDQQLAILSKVTITNKPAEISVNFSEVKEHLEKEVEQYDIVVDGDDLPGAKDVAKKLNKVKKAIDDARKEAIKKASVNISSFDSEMKELVIVCEQSRQKILDQVDQFEQEKLREILNTLASERYALYEEFEIDEEFRTVDISDLKKLTAITKTGKVTAATFNELRSRVQDAKGLQWRTEKRIMTLENTSYERGLRVPLARDHVESFLFKDDETYKNSLNHLISIELKRQAESDRKLEAQKPSSTASTNNLTVTASVSPASTTKAEIAHTDQPQNLAGEVHYVITCTFKFVADNSKFTDEQIIKGYTKKIEETGIKSLDEVKVNRWKVNY